ncbi:MAG: erythromycin biosynthesis sensory transduction protein eryC1 [Acidobacteria bacterium]|nr:erythromycin biosynthesis sensory transduction protein eryC1 [Acidobacteriota bacterium]NIM60652.1 erythromycin biosynthesis sensory transduction protein eryC1 [Acidobacteriota bacterium]NIO57939.1 erythromycin biosynthesis sensory transduction protein eryC1 [Acidobacteriota bacterium]NIQ28942.1 erythromycin biosynthesis sensory transduction protein eryC1 [Acidobacteriota bacterium]NIQ83416.1 erythromycin biosynthesis sensory transduction protein eryC1 [Acidobacteriota bacterium]
MIPFFDYRPETRRHAEGIRSAVDRVLESGRLILGPEVESFEAEFAAATGVAGAVGVASGTDAIELALRGLGVGAGSEVITVANAGVPPVAAVRAAGARPVLVDIDPATLSIDPQAVATALGPRTACLLIVHLYGFPAALEPLLELAASAGVPVVEDCAQAHGARCNGRPVGSFGTLGCYSFYPTKNLGAYGDGGMIVGNDLALLAKIRRTRVYGWREGTRRSEIEGRNSRLDEIQAAILRVKLPHLEAINTERRALAARFSELLDGAPGNVVASRPGSQPVFHLYVVRCDDRPRWADALDRAGIGHAVHYEDPVHTMPAYASLGLARGSLPHTEAACDSVISLPLYPGIDEQVFERLATALDDL